MGLYYTAYKVGFSELIVDLDVLKEDIYPLYEQLGESVYSIKSSRLYQVWPLEYAMKFMSDKGRRKTLPFFIHTVWFNYDNEYGEVVDFKRYSPKGFDDFGFLEKDHELYYRSYSCETLRKILDDFDNTIDMDEIQQAYIRSRESDMLEFVPEHRTKVEYGKLTDDLFNEFVGILSLVVRTYRECVAENKDLIIDFG